MVEQSSGLQLDKLSKVSGKELFRDSQYMVQFCQFFIRKNCGKLYFCMSQLISLSVPIMS